MKNKKLVYIVALYLILLTNLNSVYAISEPTFPSCLNPQGEVRVSYDSGTHGVVGNGNTFTGKDTVYNLSQTAHMQCLCADNGQGIQTNWINASGYSQEEISILTSQGWVLIPDGSAWGLSNDPYLAANSNYSCHGNSNGGGTGGSSTSSSNSNVGGAVLGGISTGQVLGLASTGNAPFIVSVLSLGTIMLFLGMFSRNKKTYQNQ